MGVRGKEGGHGPDPRPEERVTGSAMTRPSSRWRQRFASAIVPVSMAVRPSILFFARPENASAVNVLAASLDAAPNPPDVDARIVSTAASLEAAAAAAAAPTIVAWSFYSTGFEEAATLLQRIRTAAPNPFVSHLAGGPHATAEPKATLAAGFDAVALGEGEATIRTVARTVARGEAWTSVRGVAAFRNGAFVSSGMGEAIELDAYPAFCAARRRLNPIEITRGCVYACSFCQTPFLFKARFRHRSVENVVAHVELMARAGPPYVRFLSPTALSYGARGPEPDLTRVEALLEGVRRAAGPRGKVYFGTFPSEVRPEHVTPRALAILRRTCDNRNLVIGGQSGSDSVLTAARRGHGVEHVERAVRTCIEAGFIPNVDFIFGLPGERPSDLQQSLRFAENLTRLGARIHAHAFLPLPGTPARRAQPGVLDAAARLRLEEMASRGALYGQWKRQADAARSLGKQPAAP